MTGARGATCRPGLAWVGLQMGANALTDLKAAGFLREMVRAPCPPIECPMTDVCARGAGAHTSTHVANVSCLPCNRQQPSPTTQIALIGQVAPPAAANAKPA